MALIVNTQFPITQHNPPLHNPPLHTSYEIININKELLVIFDIFDKQLQNKNVQNEINKTVNYLLMIELNRNKTNKISHGAKKTGGTKKNIKNIKRHRQRHRQRQGQGQGQRPGQGQGQGQGRQSGGNKMLTIRFILIIICIVVSLMPREFIQSTINWLLLYPSEVFDHMIVPTCSVLDNGIITNALLVVNTSTVSSLVKGTYIKITDALGNGDMLILNSMWALILNFCKLKDAIIAPSGETTKNYNKVLVLNSLDTTATEIDNNVTKKTNTFIIPPGSKLVMLDGANLIQA